MIDVQVDQRMLHEVESKLGQFKSDTPRVISKATTSTAKWAMKELIRKAKETYTLKDKGLYRKGAKVKNATPSTMTAVIFSSGKRIALSKFNNRAVKSGVKASVVKGSGGIVPGFKNKISNNERGGQHIGVARRLTKSRLPISEYMALSVPQMLGSESKTYGKIKPQIKDQLETRCRKEIERMIARRSSGH